MKIENILLIFNMIIIKKYIGNFISMHLYLQNLENKFLTQIVDLDT